MLPTKAPGCVTSEFEIPQRTHREKDTNLHGPVSAATDDTLRKLWRAVEQSSDPLVITKLSGAIEYVNPAFENLTGYSKGNAVGHTLRILQSANEPLQKYRAMWQTVVSGNTFRGTLVNRKRNGEAFSVERTISPLRDSAGDITHFISSDRDITERCRLELQLQQAHKMDAIGRLAGGVAHDFNNLLMVISSYAELMLDSLGAKHPLRRNVEEIMAASRRATDLTRQLLAFGRKQMQSLHLLDLNSVIHEISRMLLRLMGDDIEFVFIPGASLGNVKADPVQIEQVLMNLAGNAGDAMPDGGKLTIETASVIVDEVYVQRHSIVPAGDYVLVTVSDTGTGIAPQHLPHIFEPFYTTKHEGEGTGLGLATVYGIVKQSGGFIWVYSEAGMGTTFKIYLPRIQSQPGELQIFRPVEESTVPGCETLLLVEDEPAVRQSEREFLRLNGYIVLEASDGEDALHIASEYSGPIHLMITDVVMPRMGGAKLAHQLRCARPDIKVLFVSGYAESTVLRQGPVDLSTNFLQKPFALKVLARKIRAVLEMNIGAEAASGSAN